MEINVQNVDTMEMKIITVSVYLAIIKNLVLGSVLNVLIIANFAKICKIIVSV